MVNINELLKQTNLESIDSESNSYKELEEGYYLCQVEDAKLTTSKSSGNPMVSFTFKITEDGNAISLDEEKNINLSKIKNTKNKKIFLHFVLKDTTSVQRFVSDMLKFEGDEEGVPVLSKEYFVNEELLESALEILIGLRIYIHNSASQKEDGTVTYWKNLISWKRASLLELPL